MDGATIEKQIKQDRAVLEASLNNDKTSEEDIKSNFETLIKSLSKKLVIDLKKIAVDNKDQEDDKITDMQKQEVEKFQIIVVDIAHYIDNKFKEQL